MTKSTSSIIVAIALTIFALMGGLTGCADLPAQFAIAAASSVAADKITDTFDSSCHYYDEAPKWPGEPVCRNADGQFTEPYRP